MTDEILYRASLDVVAEGRTLVGLAVPWNKPAKVTDGGPLYNEAFAPDSFTRSLDNHGSEPFPLFNNHGWRRGEDPIGTVSFKRTAEGLLYEAPLSRTAAADDQLTLVRDGAKRSVSIGFRPFKARQVVMAGEPVTLRTEVGMRELSLAASGFGLHPDAKVLAIRDDEGDAGEDDEAMQRTEELRRQIRKARLSPPPPA